MDITPHRLSGCRVLLLAALALVVALLLSARAAAATKQSPCAHPPETPFTYHWPVKPFDRQHPVRAAFGDPRTVNVDQRFGVTGRYELGADSFHNGVDIVARPDTPVYPVVSGEVVVDERDEIVVRTDDNRSFQYYHLLGAVTWGQFVIAERTVLGWVQARYGHVHLAEIDGGIIHNPLDPGHLEPYRDRTTPEAVGLYVDVGRQPSPMAGSRLRPQDRLAVEAVDPPTMPLPGPWLGLPQTPALVEWRLLHHGGHGPWKIAADFRKTEPAPPNFWNVYGAGTYQNSPAFAHHLYLGAPGRYLFRIGLHPNRLSRGLYHLEVRVADVCRNQSTATWPLKIG